MKIEIIHESIRFNLHGIGSVVENERYGEVGLRLMNELWQVVIGPVSDASAPTRVNCIVPATRKQHHPASAGSQPRVHGFTLQGKDAEDALMHPPQRFSTNEPFQSLDAEGELAEGE